MLKEYELMLMMHAESDKDKRAAVVKQVEDIIVKNGGSWVDTAEWGRTQLAYEIDHQDHAWYYLLKFDSEPTGLAEASRVLGITDGVIRHMAVARVDETSSERTGTVIFKKQKKSKRDR